VPALTTSLCESGLLEPRTRRDRRHSVQDEMFLKNESVLIQIGFFAADVAAVKAKLDEQTIESSLREFCDYGYLLASRYVRSVLAGRNACVEVITSHAVASNQAYGVAGSIHVA
jgi:hypothetical protein